MAPQEVGGCWANAANDIAEISNPIVSEFVLMRHFQVCSVLLEWVVTSVMARRETARSRGGRVLPGLYQKGTARERNRRRSSAFSARELFRSIHESWGVEDRRRWRRRGRR